MKKEINEEIQKKKAAEKKLAQKLADSWREGYDSGVKTAMSQNSNALAIGRAILDVLDDRYEFKEEDY